MTDMALYDLVIFMLLIVALMLSVYLLILLRRLRKTIESMRLF